MLFFQITYNAPSPSLGLSHLRFPGNTLNWRPRYIHLPQLPVHINSSKLKAYLQIGYLYRREIAKQCFSSKWNQEHPHKVTMTWPFRVSANVKSTLLHIISVTLFQTKSHAKRPRILRSIQWRPIKKVSIQIIMLFPKVLLFLFQCLN